MHNNKTNFIIFIIFLAVAMCNLVCFAQTQEQLDITTYYPSPTGVYQQLRLFPKDFDTSVNCNGKEGTLAFHATNDALYICDGTGHWKQMSGQPQAGTPYGWVPIIDVYNSAVPPANTCLAIGKVPCPDPDSHATTYLQNCKYRNTPDPIWGDMGSVMFCFEHTCGACVNVGPNWSCKGVGNGCGQMAIAVHCCNP